MIFDDFGQLENTSSSRLAPKMTSSASGNSKVVTEKTHRRCSSPCELFWYRNDWEQNWQRLAWRHAWGRKHRGLVLEAPCSHFSADPSGDCYPATYQTCVLAESESLELLRDVAWQLWFWFGWSCWWTTLMARYGMLPFLLLVDLCQSVQPLSFSTRASENGKERNKIWHNSH